MWTHPTIFWLPTKDLRVHEGDMERTSWDCGEKSLSNICTFIFWGRWGSGAPWGRAPKICMPFWGEGPNKPSKFQLLISNHLRDSDSRFMIHTAGRRKYFDAYSLLAESTINRLKLQVTQSVINVVKCLMFIACGPKTLSAESMESRYKICCLIQSTADLCWDQSPITSLTVEEVDKLISSLPAKSVLYKHHCLKINYILPLSAVFLLLFRIN